MDNLRRFLVIFSLMFLVACAVCGFLLARNYGDAMGESVEDYVISAPTYNPEEDQEQQIPFQDNIMCVIGTPGQKESVAMFLLNIDSKANALSVLFVPNNLKYGIASTSTVGKFGDMNGLYGKDAAQQAATVFASYMDIDVKYYFYITLEDFGKLITSFSSEDSGVFYDLPVNLKYRNLDDPTEIVIDLKAGGNYYKGSMVEQLFSFYKTEDNVYDGELAEYYDGSYTCRINTQMEFIDAFLRQKFSEAQTDTYRQNFVSYFLPYIEKASTNLTEPEIIRIGSVISNLQSSNLNYYCVTGKSIFTGNDVYVEFQNYFNDLRINSSISMTRADDILRNRFKSSGNS